MTPFIVGCQVYADVTAPDGSKILDFASPETANGLSGLGLQPVNPHTVRGAGEVRARVWSATARRRPWVWDRVIIPSPA